MNREVNLTKRIKTEAGLRYCPAVLSANGRIRPDYVLVAGREEQHPEGSYYLEWRDGTKRIRVSVGKNAADALARRLRKEAELNAIAKGVKIVADSESRQTIASTVAAYLEEIELSKKPKTFAAYSRAFELFQHSCRKLYLDEIDRTDMLRFAAYMRDELELSARTVSNNWGHVIVGLKAMGREKVTRKGDWPVYVEEEPEVYSPAELTKLFKHCDYDERLWFQFFEMTGMREQEVMHTYWSDLNLAAGSVRVTHKPDRNWTPKAYKERSIPIPSKLVKLLKIHKRKHANGCPLLFPTSGCKPKLDFLDCLKAVAERAGLEPSNFWLHKFRSTFATRYLQAGIDLRTVQSWLGHADLESTMRYLKAAEIHAVKHKVDAIFK